MDDYIQKLIDRYAKLDRSDTAYLDEAEAAPIFMSLIASLAAEVTEAEMLRHQSEELISEVARLRQRVADLEFNSQTMAIDLATIRNGA